MYPNATQRDILNNKLRPSLHAVWNMAARWAEEHGKAPAYAQFRAVRGSNLLYSQVNSMIQNSVLRRYKNSTSSVIGHRKKGKKASMPRPVHFDKFLSFDNFQVKDTGAYLKPAGGGFKLLFARSGVFDLGEIRCRGSIPLDEWDLKAITLIYEPITDKWSASVVVATDSATRSSGGSITGIDLGLRTFATTATDCGEASKYGDVKDPTALRYKLNAIEKKVKEAQKVVSRRGVRDSKQRLIKRTNRYNKARKAAFVLQRKAARVRRDHHHKLSAQVISQSLAVVTEDLGTQAMMKSGGAYKKGLNRAIGKAGWDMFLRMLEYKCKEACIDFAVLHTREIAPTQTCSCCGVRTKHGLNVEVWTCGSCGASHDRDINAAKNMVNWYLNELTLEEN